MCSGMWSIWRADTNKKGDLDVFGDAECVGRE